MDEFKDFRQTWNSFFREHIDGVPDTPLRNGVAVAATQVLDYLTYLEITLARYEVAREHFFEEHLDESGGLRMDDDEQTTLEMLERRRRLSVELQLEIEAFYLFSRILLDRLVLLNHALLGWLGQESLSHSRFASTIRNRVSPGNSALGDMLAKIETLQEVVDVRDDKIVHEKSPRATKATGFRGREDAYIVYHRLFPKEGEKQVNAPSPPQLALQLGEYLVTWLQLVSGEFQQK